MADPPVIPQAVSPTDPRGVAALAQALHSIFSPGASGANAIAQRVSDPSFIYDPTAQLASIARDSQFARGLPTGADIEAQTAQRQAQGADYLYQQLSGVPVAQEGFLDQPNLPQLQLPDQPDTARPQVSPLAQLLSIGASFAAPQSAGQFNAAALQGAIKGAEEENQRRQQRDRVDVARRAMLYDAAFTNAKEQQRVSELNKDRAFRNDVATVDRQLSLAKAKSDQFTARNTADALSEFATRYDPALKAQARVKAGLDLIDTQSKSFAERAKGMSEIINALTNSEKTGSGAGLSAKVLEEVLAGTRDAAKDRAQDVRNDKNNAASMGRTQYIQGAETSRALTLADKNAASAMSRLKYEQGQINSRLQTSLKEMKPSESLKQSEQNQTMLRTHLGDLDAAISKAVADTEFLRSGGVIGDLSGDAAVSAYGAKVTSLINSRTVVRARLQSEEARAKLLDKKNGKGGIRSTFDPRTGEVVFP